MLAVLAGHFPNRRVDETIGLVRLLMNETLCITQDYGCGLSFYSLMARPFKAGRLGGSIVFLVYDRLFSAAAELWRPLPVAWVSYGWRRIRNPFLALSFLHNCCKWHNVVVFAPYDRTVDISSIH